MHSDDPEIRSLIRESELAIERCRIAARTLQLRLASFQAKLDQNDAERRDDNAPTVHDSTRRPTRN
jgi:hypothetical protein